MYIYIYKPWLFPYCTSTVQLPQLFGSLVVFLDPTVLSTVASSFPSVAIATTVTAEMTKRAVAWRKNLSCWAPWEKIVWRCEATWNMTRNFRFLGPLPNFEKEQILQTSQSLLFRRVKLVHTHKSWSAYWNYGWNINNHPFVELQSALSLEFHPKSSGIHREIRFCWFDGQTKFQTIVLHHGTKKDNHLEHVTMAWAQICSHFIFQSATLGSIIVSFTQISTSLEVISIPQSLVTRLSQWLRVVKIWQLVGADWLSMNLSQRMFTSTCFVFLNSGYLCFNWGPLSTANCYLKDMASWLQKIRGAHFGSTQFRSFFFWC